MTNKLLLAAIAFGLWANAATSLVRPVQAQTDQLTSEVRRIAEELRQLVENGDQCLNPKLWKVADCDGMLDCCDARAMRNSSI
jgi:hypothetical protein